jgi:hypothetical protein
LLLFFLPVTTRRHILLLWRNLLEGFFIVN